MAELPDHRQEQFCQFYIFGKETRGNGRKSMLEAGYSKGHARGGATQLKKKPEIISRLDELKKEFEKTVKQDHNKEKYSAKSIMKEIDAAKEIALEKKDWRGVLSAVKIKAQLLGYIDSPSKFNDDLGISTLKNQENNLVNTETNVHGNVVSIDRVINQ